MSARATPSNQVISGFGSHPPVIEQPRRRGCGAGALMPANANERVRDGTAFVALCAEHLGQQEAAAQLEDICAARVLRLRPPGPKAMT